MGTDKALIRWRNLASKVLDRRRMLEMTQKEVGEVVFKGKKAPTQHYSNIERGIQSITPKRAKILCDKLQMGRDELLDAVALDYRTWFGRYYDNF